MVTEKQSFSLMGSYKANRIWRRFIQEYGNQVTRHDHALRAGDQVVQATTHSITERSCAQRTLLRVTLETGPSDRVVAYSNCRLRIQLVKPNCL